MAGSSATYWVVEVREGSLRPGVADYVRRFHFDDEESAWKCVTEAEYHGLQAKLPEKVENGQLRRGQVREPERAD